MTRLVTRLVTASTLTASALTASALTASVLTASVLLLAASLLLPATAAAQDAQGEPPAAGADRPWTPEELAEVQEVELDFQAYRDAANRHEHRVQAILYREFMDRKSKLETKYAERVKNTTDAHRARTTEAIALLEEFLRKYPDHESYTPDAMFRLADLYIDEAEFEYEKRLELQMLGIKDGTTPKPAPEDEEPLADGEIPYDGPDYSPAMTLWRTIVERFPQYRQLDGTLYLLGYYLGQIGRERESKQVYLGLVCANKYKPLDAPPPALTRDEIRAKIDTKSAFTDYEGCESLSQLAELVEEAWVRGIADAHFNAAGELAEAIAAYTKVAYNKESKYYDEALYKLAWSYYRNDDFELGIKAFDDSVVYSDAREAEGKDPLDLRGEAITYIAISFTDPWSLSEQADPARSYGRAFAFYENRLGERHVRDVFEELGDTFKVIEGYEQAIDSWRLVVKNWPLHPRAPVVHQKIVTAFEAMGEKDLADDEAAKLAQLYAKGTEWYKANETDREAMDSQARISQRMLRATAENVHRSAQLARKDWEASKTAEDRERYIALYAKAADLYTLYLTQYPDSPEIYEFTYRIADTKFFSEQYLESVPHYAWVRDHKELSGEYYLKSALSIVQAYQAEVDLQLAAGTLTEPPVPTAEQLKAMGPDVQPLEVPQVYKDLRDAYDEYQNLVDDPKSAPTMGLAAALVSYRHLDLDDAIVRFTKAMDRFCGAEAEAVAQAKDGLLVIYEYRGENDKFTATNDKFISGSCGDAKSIEIAKSQNRSIEFNKAEKLFTAQKYDEAAIAFYRFYKTAPDDDPNLPIALYDSAIAYERSGRPKTAIFLFKEFTNSPLKKFRDSVYYIEALYLTAVAQQKAFDYQGAVDTYLDVVKVANEPGRTNPPGQRTLAQIRLDALFNAALLRELDRVYKDPKAQPGTGAISLYRKYDKLETDRRKKDRTVWAIARVYESMRDHRSMVQTYGEWRGKYGRDAGNEQDYVFSFYNTIAMYKKKGVQDKTIDKVRQEVLKAWETVGKPTGTPTAEMAAEQEFYFAEKHYVASVERYKFDWPKDSDQAKKVTAALDKFDRVTEGGREKFKAIGKYQSNKFGAGAIVRIGDIEFFAAQKLVNAPAPKKILKLDEKFPDKGILDLWQSRIEEIVEPRSAFAIEQWKKVVQTAKTVGTSNVWTKLALERLHDFDNPELFPVLRADEIGTTENP